MIQEDPQFPRDRHAHIDGAPYDPDPGLWPYMLPVVVILVVGIVSLLVVWM